MQHEDWMRLALEQAAMAEAHDEVPIGAVVVLNNEVIGKGYNQTISTNDPTAHAEIVALRDAARHCNNYRLPGVSLYVTIEPCTMCAGAMTHARIDTLVYGATEPKAGVVDSHSGVINQSYLNHEITVIGGVLAENCSLLIKHFFAKKREEKKLRK